MISWPTLALAACVGLLSGAAFAQAVPKVFPQGEIVVGLDFIGFTAQDILSARTINDQNGHGVLLELDPRLDEAVAAISRGKTGIWFELYLCGQRLLSARIAEELTKASFRITATDASAAEALAQAFLHPACAFQTS